MVIGIERDDREINSLVEPQDFHGELSCMGAGTPSRQIVLPLGQQVRIILGTLGPGQYESPPTTSGSSARFLDMSVCCNNPGGVVQVFRFVAVAPGQTIAAFHHTDLSRSVVEDTMIVR